MIHLVVYDPGSVLCWAQGEITIRTGVVVGGKFYFVGTCSSILPTSVESIRSENSNAVRMFCSQHSSRGVHYLWTICTRAWKSVGWLL